MERARLWVEVPAAEHAFREGDVDRLLDIVPPSKHATLPTPAACDDFVLDLYADVSSIGSGQPLELVRWRCELEGLEPHQALEVWTRISEAHFEIAAFRAAMRQNDG